MIDELQHVAYEVNTLIEAAEDIEGGGPNGLAVEDPTVLDLFSNWLRNRAAGLHSRVVAQLQQEIIDAHIDEALAATVAAVSPVEAALADDETLYRAAFPDEYADELQEA